jgi:hypothetical protein
LNTDVTIKIPAIPLPPSSPGTFVKEDLIGKVLAVENNSNAYSLATKQADSQSKSLGKSFSDEFSVMIKSTSGEPPITAKNLDMTISCELMENSKEAMPGLSHHSKYSTNF